MTPAGLRALVLLSILAAVVTIALKATAYSLTRSVGLLSDALESGINLLAALTAYLSLHYSHRPVDATHTYGHQKIEFFSSGLEGVLIVVAGVVTGVRLIVRSFNGLMDHALDPADLDALRAAIRTHSPPGTDFHALRSRQAGASKFADFHLLVPGAMSVREAHDLGERIETSLR